MRGLTRAFDLAQSLNDRSLKAAATTRLLDEAADALETITSRGPADEEAESIGRVTVGLLEHCASATTQRSSEARLNDLIRRLSDLIRDPWSIERLAKITLARTDDEAERHAITENIIDAFRTYVPATDALRHLMFLRQALRAAEEYGHPSHGRILHEIETLDTDGAFDVIRTEFTVSRSTIADFCLSVVRDDNIEAALTRFTMALPVTPERVHEIRWSTETNLLHLVSSYQIGEANSIVTGTDTTGHDLGHSKERHVPKQVADSA